MKGGMMACQLTIPAIMRQAEQRAADREIVSRQADGSLFRYSYAQMVRRAKQLALALTRLGVAPGDRVATFAWNHHRHVEAYFAVPAIGAVLHTLNVRLTPADLAPIVAEAGDRTVFADAELLPSVEQWARTAGIERIIVMGDVSPSNEQLLSAAASAKVDAYEELLAGIDPDDFAYQELDEWSAAAMCHTSGTTGRAKGVVYSHRALVLESMHWTAVDCVGVGSRDVMLSVVPMFHVTGWGIPYTAALAGAKLVLPGRALDPASLLPLIEGECVTVSAGVPTVWLNVADAIDDGMGTDISSLRTIIVGGSAVPAALLERYDRYGVRMVHAWGMTETTALATIAQLPLALESAPRPAQAEWRTRQGRPLPFIEIRARSEAGLVPWDGTTMGELEVRGPTIASEYFGVGAPESSFTSDGWFRTGDIVTIDSHGSIQCRDRAHDMIKSGGEWISSIALENTLMCHPAVAEAAVIAVADARWGERPLACVVVRRGRSATREELVAFLSGTFPKWWLPDRIEFVTQLPLSSTGKFSKATLRRWYAEGRLGSEIA